MPSIATGRPLPYHHGNLRAALIEAALSLIDEKGAKALTVRQVARRAGVSHTAPYRHFKDKADLLAAVAVQGFDMMVADMHRRMDRYQTDSRDRLKACGISYITFAIDHPAHFRVMFGPGTSECEYFSFVASATSAFQTLLDSIEACQQEGWIRSGNSDELALAAWSMVHGFAMLYIENRILAGRDAAPMMESVLDRLFEGLRA